MKKLMLLAVVMFAVACSQEKTYKVEYKVWYKDFSGPQTFEVNQDFKAKSDSDAYVIAAHGFYAVARVVRNAHGVASPASFVVIDENSNDISNNLSETAKFSIEKPLKDKFWQEVINKSDSTNLNNIK